jgi:hypothetical protein
MEVGVRGQELVFGQHDPVVDGLRMDGGDEGGTQHKRVPHTREIGMHEHGRFGIYGERLSAAIQRNH